MAESNESGDTLACRYLYSLNGPPSPEVLTAVRAVLQATSLVLVALVSSGNFLGDKSQRADKDAAKVQTAASAQLYPWHMPACTTADRVCSHDTALPASQHVLRPEPCVEVPHGHVKGSVLPYQVT